MRNVDVEITNRCNALCNFCPRDRMPALGGMDDTTFDKVLDRLAEYPEPLFVTFCGFGEPMVHPQLVSFVEKAANAGFEMGITTNASLLTPDRSKHLLELGLKKMVFSISDLGEDYEEVYNLDYDRTSQHIDAFLEYNAHLGNPCEVWVSLVEHDINREKLEDYRQHWRARGITNFFESPENNRGGAVERGETFIGTYRYFHESRQMLREEGVPHLCRLPLFSISVSWEGDYLLCCMDWEKRMPLGSIFDHSIQEMDKIKYSKISTQNPVCRDCSINPINPLREYLLEADSEGEDPRKKKRAINMARLIQARVGGDMEQSLLLEARNKKSTEKRLARDQPISFMGQK